MALIAMKIMVQALRYIEVLASLLLFCSLLVYRLANVGPCSLHKSCDIQVDESWGMWVMKAGAIDLQQNTLMTVERGVSVTESVKPISNACV